ncbi:putative quinone oxidoreductase [Xylariaceae sp. FL1019]|nr:putative quinone oxidoreductase [Xylariaceae sp. FL1019]
MAQNKAAFLDGANVPLRVGDLDMPKAEPDRVVVRNRAVAVNPADWKIQDNPAFIHSFPLVLGGDAAGEVIEVGVNVRNVKVGDRVLGHGVCLGTQVPTDGCFAFYTSLPASNTAVIPSSVSFAEASVLPLCLDTAAQGLYGAVEDGFLGLTYPSIRPTPIGKVIVVWGGSSSVGACTTQLAVASGVEVIAVASQRNFDFCKKCGASQVFDYKSNSVVQDIVEAVEAIGASFAGVYDAISELGQSYEPALEILKILGRGNFAVVAPPPKSLPQNVKSRMIIAINSESRPLWRDYITPALENGLLKCLPEPMIVGRGLDAIQEGLDTNKKGVSAKKVVIEL